MLSQNKFGGLDAIFGYGHRDIQVYELFLKTHSCGFAGEHTNYMSNDNIKLVFTSPLISL